jgi:four helix bundle protein
VAFLNRAEASFEEAGYLLDFARRLTYLNEQRASHLLAMQDEAARTLRGLITRIRRDLAANA